MLDVIQQNWPAVAVVLAVAAVLLWWLLSRTDGDRRERYRAPDALDEGAAPAQRNQALIDAPSAAKAAAGLAGTGPDILGGIGEVVAAAAAQEAVAEAAAAGDDLTRIKGLGPKLAARLRELGVTRFAQIAAWDDAELARIDGQLGTFAGRPQRDAWVEQARFLAHGDVAGYEARFGKL